MKLYGGIGPTTAAALADLAQHCLADGRHLHHNTLEWDTVDTGQLGRPVTMVWQVQAETCPLET